MKNFKKLLLVSSAAAALAVVGAQDVNAQVLGESGLYYESAGSNVLYNGFQTAGQLNVLGNPAYPGSVDSNLGYETLYVEDNDLAYGVEEVSQTGVDRIERNLYTATIEDGVITDYTLVDTEVIQEGRAHIVRVGTYVEADQDNPTGEPEGVPTDEAPATPEVVGNDEITWHAPQQNDSEIRGHIEESGVVYVEIRKNGLVIASGSVDPDGYFTAELQEAIEYGNDIEIWGFNSEGNRIFAVSDVASVDYVAVAHTPNPIRLDAITTDGSLDADANHVQGYTRPYNKVYIRVYDPTNQTYTNEWIVAYADANGFFNFDLGSLAKDGFEVHLYTEDSSGNKSEVQELTINDDSTVEAAVVRRTHTGDNAVTVRSYPYAYITVELERDDIVIGTYNVRADGNGLARLNLGAHSLQMNDKLNIFAEVEGRPSGTHVHYVRLPEDNTRPEAPEVDEVVEGSTILKGTAEAYALVSARWLEDGSLNWTEIFTLADENGNFLFDLFEFGFTTPFQEGVEVLVRAHDNNLNHTTKAVSVMPAGTPTVGTELPIEANPEFPGEVDGDKDPDNGDKDKDPKPVKPGKPGKKDKADAATLPETGESSSYLVFGTAALSILAGLGLVAPKFKKED